MKKLDTPEALPLAFQLAWNTHDTQLFGCLFTDDATFVNRFGHYVCGVDSIIEMHEPVLKTVYSDSTLENELIQIKYLEENVAITHFWSRLTAGRAHPDGPHKVDTLIMAVLIRKDKHWLIQALENVALTNPRTGQAVLRS